MAVTQPSQNNKIREFTNWLLKTHASLADLLEIRRAQLMMAIALVLTIINLLAVLLILALRAEAAGAWVLLGWSVFCAAAYALGRTRWVTLGSLLLLVSTILLGCWMVANGSLGFDNGQVLYSTFVLAYIIGSVLLNVRSLGALVLLSSLGVLGLAQQTPGLEMLRTSQQVGIIAATGILLMIVTGYRNGLESARLAALQAANRELTDIQATLEQRVEERTRSVEAARREAEEARQQSEQAWLKTGAQAWRDAGRVQLSEVMRGEQDLAALAGLTLAKICQIMDAQAGALYLTHQDGQLPGATQRSEEREGRLYFVGGYAFVPAESEPQDFSLGEGLVGQAALDRRGLLLNVEAKGTAPAGALTVRLGLGELRPRQLLLQPILYGERLVGVLELATLHEFPAAGVEFLESVAESMGVAFHTAQTRAQVDVLLQQTQAQAEELQAREEELRAMNEELQTQAEGMRRGWEQKPNHADPFSESG